MRIVRDGEVAKLRYHSWKLPLLLAALAVTCLALSVAQGLNLVALQPGQKVIGAAA